MALIAMWEETLGKKRGRGQRSQESLQCPREVWLAWARMVSRS